MTHRPITSQADHTLVTSRSFQPEINLEPAYNQLRISQSHTSIATGKSFQGQMYHDRSDQSSSDQNVKNYKAEKPSNLRHGRSKSNERKKEKSVSFRGAVLSD